MKAEPFATMARHDEGVVPSKLCTLHKFAMLKYLSSKHLPSLPKFKRPNPLKL